MVTKIEDYRGTTRDELLNQLAVAEACREFWYRAYVRASTYAIEQIDAAVEVAKNRIRKDHEGCDAALDAMEENINRVIRGLFLTDARRTGSNAVLPSSVPPDTDRT